MRDDDFFNSPFDDIVRELLGNPVRRVRKKRY